MRFLTQEMEFNLYQQLGLRNTFLGFSDEEIKLDIQQQRIEKAVGSELTKNT
jgi:hypothetical protein